MTTQENSTTYVLPQVKPLPKKGPSHSNSLKKNLKRFRENRDDWVTKFNLEMKTNPKSLYKNYRRKMSSNPTSGKKKLSIK